MDKNIALGFFRVFYMAVMKVVLFVVGIPVVWYALKKGTWIDSEQIPFTQFPQYGNWMRIRLPKWALLWDNAFDGILGDKRGWWWNYCVENYELPGNDKYSMWKWTAFRNPCNYYSRVVCGIDVSKVKIEEVSKSGVVETEPYKGWFLLKATAEDGKVYPRFYYEKALYKTYGINIDIGWKIKLSHVGTPTDAEEKDRIKGIAFYFSPWKELS